MFVAVAIPLGTFWSLARVARRGWHFHLAICAFGGFVLGVLLVVLWSGLNIWGLLAVCAAGGAAGGVISLALSGVYRAIAGTVLMACLAWNAAWYVPDTWSYPSKFREAYDVIGRIEEFRKVRGRFPTSLEENGRSDDEGGPLYYNLARNGGYEVSFRAPRYGFFGMLSYHSVEKTWTGAD